MKLLAEVTDKDFNPKFVPDKNRRYIFRRAARAVIINRNGEVGVIYVNKEDYYKIPGGGIKADEDIAAALEREVKEESGCKCGKFKELGIIIDQRSILEEDLGFVQLSYGFTARVKKEGRALYTKQEESAGFEFKWMSIEDAVNAFERHNVDDYHGRFMQKRDGLFVREAVRKIGSNTGV
ncbi:MAG: NUDIX domain-containing protein [Patescibacteria group bacterium]|nr:NUDIX domain-containing protein [Patescibacteria group bacterium]